MNTTDFVKLLQEELELSVELDYDTNLKDLDEWDSMAAMIIIGLVSNEFDILLNGEDIKEITTLKSLLIRIKLL